MAVMTAAEKAAYVDDLKRRLNIVRAGGTDQNGASADRIIAEIERVGGVEWVEDSNGDTIDDTTPNVEKSAAASYGGSAWDYDGQTSKMYNQQIIDSVNPIKNQDKSFGKPFWQGIGNGVGNAWDGVIRVGSRLGNILTWAQNFVDKYAKWLIALIIASFFAKIFSFDLDVDV